MNGLLNEVYDYLVQQLGDDGLPVVIDVRNVQPPCILVDPPTFVAQSGSMVTVEFPVTAICPPPGNRDQMIRLLELADRVIETQTVTTGSAGSYSVGQQDLPAYSMTVRIQAQRSQ
jgi:hypothetical protein